MELKGFLSDEAAALLDVGVSPVDDAQAKIHAQPFSEARKKECDMACAYQVAWGGRPTLASRIQKTLYSVGASPERQRPG